MRDPIFHKISKIDTDWYNKIQGRKLNGPGYETYRIIGDTLIRDFDTFLYVKITNAIKAGI